MKLRLWAATLLCAHSAMAVTPPQFSVVYTFSQQTGGLSTRLVVGNDGNLYGASARGGLGFGSIFGVTPSTGSLTTIYAYPQPGAFGYANPSPLAVGVDGALYGIDIAHANSIFRLTTDGSFSDIATVPNEIFTTAYFGLLAASDGSFYVVGYDTNDQVTQIYRVTPDGTATLIHALNPSAEGTKPFNLIEGFDGNIYGVTSKSFFTIRPNGTFAVLTTFPIPVNNPGSYAAAQPTCGTGIVQSSDGNFYCLNNGLNYAGYNAANILGLSSTGSMILNESFNGPPVPGVPNPVGNVFAPLTLGADGNMYGVSDTSGSTSNVFQVTNTGQLTVVYSTPTGGGGGGGGGSGFLGLALASDGTLYGGTPSTLNDPYGYIFKLGPGTGGTPITLSYIAPALLDAQPAFVTADSVNNNFSGLVSDPNALMASGRAVVGAAADGVSRVLLRAMASTTLEYSLLDENMNPVGYSTEYGGLAQVTGSGTPFSSGVPITPVSVNGRSMAFVAYRAPMDFVRADPNFNASDQMADSRTVNIQVATPDGTVVTTYPITLVRPPVVMIHGITSAPKFWKTFSPLVTSCAAQTVSGDPRFYVQCADWSKKIPGVLAIDPDYLGTSAFLLTINPVRQNELGYAYNAPVVFGQMQNTVANYSQSAPTAGNKPIASVQVDAVGHSMGNLVARTMPYVLTTSPNSYLATANYGQGIMHKLISIAGPHFGSPMAIVALDPANACTWFGPAIKGEYPLNSAVLPNLTKVSGGTLDLTGDGQGNCVSPALNVLQGSADKQIPTALIAGEMSNSQLTGLDSSFQALAIQLALKINAVKLACGTDYSFTDYNSAGWLTMTKTTAADQSDAFVPVTSALDGLDASSGCMVQGGQTPATPPCNISLIQYAVHGPGTVSEIGFPGPQILQASTSAPLVTINLLNAKVSDPAFATLPSRVFNQVGGCK